MHMRSCAKEGIVQSKLSASADNGTYREKNSYDIFFQEEENSWLIQIESYIFFF